MLSLTKGVIERGVFARDGYLTSQEVADGLEARGLPPIPSARVGGFLAIEHYRKRRKWVIGKDGTKKLITAWCVAFCQPHTNQKPQ